MIAFLSNVGGVGPWRRLCPLRILCFVKKAKDMIVRDMADICNSVV